MNREALERIQNTIQANLRRESIPSKGDFEESNERVIIKTPKSVDPLKESIPENFIYNGNKYIVDSIRSSGAIMDQEFERSPAHYKYKITISEE